MITVALRAPCAKRKRYKLTGVQRRALWIHPSIQQTRTCYAQGTVPGAGDPGGRAHGLELWPEDFQVRKLLTSV